MESEKASSDPSSVRSDPSLTILRVGELIFSFCHRVANVVKTWVREYMDHEAIDHELLRGIAEFAQKQMGKGSAQTIQITNLVEERVCLPPPRPVQKVMCPPSFLSASSREQRQQARQPGAWSGSALGPASQHAQAQAPRPRPARDRTPVDSQGLCPLRQDHGTRVSRQGVAEAVRLGRTQHQYDDRPLERCWSLAQALLVAITHSRPSKVTRWVTETILVDSDLKKRANTIKHFITIAEVSSSLSHL